MLKSPRCSQLLNCRLQSPMVCLKILLHLKLSIFLIFSFYNIDVTSTATLPPLGWQNWNYWRNNFNASIFRQTAAFLESSGLRDAGYSLISFGGIGYASGAVPGGNISRNATGYLQADEVRFGGNEGVRNLSQYLHSKGFTFGSYTEAGTTACNGAKGSSEGYEVQDAALFLSEWDSDYLMVDSCGIVPKDGRTIAQQAKYELTLWRKLITNTSREIILHDCHNGCASTFSGPTLEAMPCDLSSDLQLWRMALDGSYSPLMSVASGQCAGCGGEPMGGCGGSVSEGLQNLKHGLGMQACIACRDMWNGTGKYACRASETGIGESQQIFNFSGGYIRQKQYGSCLSVARNGKGPEIVTQGGPFEPECNASSMWNAIIKDGNVRFQSHSDPSLCLSQGKFVPSSIDPWCLENNNMFRSSTDTLQVWTRVMVEIESIALQGNISRPNAWAFPDCLEIGVPGQGVLTWEETKSNLALFSITSSPLFLGNDAREGKMQQRLVDLLTNRLMLDINQQYVREFAGGRLSTRPGGIEVWAKPLNGYAAAVALFNRGGHVPSCDIAADKPEMAPCDDDTAASWGMVNVTLNFATDLPNEWILANGSGTIECEIVDVFATPKYARRLGRINGSYTARIPPHGTSFLKIENCA